MSFDFSSITARANAQHPVDPIEIFQSATVSDQGINDLWLAQGDALRDWHAHRDQPDTAIVLNTGAGKTLVGLLAAQSLVNEHSGHVLYACSSIQLIEQTASKADGYGLDVTTYHSRQFSNDRYTRGLAPCITTYHALFTGKSRFFTDDITAVVFDDAHTAEHLLRDHFSLHIDRSLFPDAYTQLVAMFKAYHDATDRATSFAEMQAGSSDSIFLIPPFEVARSMGEIRRVLASAALDSMNDTKYTWPHIRDHEDLCALFVSSSAVTLTPPIVPVGSLPYFKSGVRRLYLSATLTAPDSFARTFGRQPSRIVAPSTTAGECERLILFPSKTEPAAKDLEVARDLIADKKTLILVPTYSRAEAWNTVAEPPLRKKVTAAVNVFKNASPESGEKLMLVGRYDGIDLPGDTCRFMVIDDLTLGTGPLERFLWESLGLSNSLRSALASRIVQSFGRISRGMSDHGVVIVTGKRLVDWILVPKNAAALPAFLQKQIQLGYQVSQKADSADHLRQAANACLGRGTDWTRTYNHFMRDCEISKDPTKTDLAVNVAVAEAEYISALWRRDYTGAARKLTRTLEDALRISASTGAWHCLWLGYAQELAGDADTARALYRRAHGIQRKIPCMRPDSATESRGDTPRQVIEIAQQIEERTDGRLVLPRNLHEDLALLNGKGSVPQTEEALRCLGQYLGFDSSRPDNEHGTGPDVLWIIDETTALCIEAKTKKTSEHYQKNEVSQLSDHVQWVRNRTTLTTILPVLVGPLVPATSSTNPGPDVVVIELSELEELATRLVAALRDATSVALPITLAAVLSDVLLTRTLLWPAVFDTLSKTRLQDLS